MPLVIAQLRHQTRRQYRQKKVEFLRRFARCFKPEVILIPPIQIQSC